LNFTTATNRISWDNGTEYLGRQGDSIIIGTQGTNKVFVNSAGNVGIGTDSPGSKLDVRGSAVFNEEGSDADFRIEGDTDANLFFVDASTDRVGIGTSSPSGSLDINGTLYVGATGVANNLYIRTGQAGVSETALRIRTDTSSNLYLDATNASIKLGNQSADVDIRAGNSNVTIGNSSAGTLANQFIRFMPANTERMRLDGNGNLGIGTTSPLDKIHVSGAQTTIRLNNSVGYDTQLRLTDSVSDWSVGINQGNAVGSGFFNIRSITAGSNRLTIDTSGRVGIGTITPSTQLHVIGSGLFSGDVTASGSFIGGSGTAALPSFEFINDADTGLFSPAANTFAISTSGTERLRIDNIGNLGIGNSPQAGFKLDVQGASVIRGNILTNSLIQEFGNSRYQLHSGATSNSVSYVCNGGGRFGVGFTAPSGLVAISGGVAVGSNYNLTPPTNGLIVEGNVGVGTTSPTSRLHVVGSGLFSGDVTANGSFIGGSGTALLPSFEFINDPDTGMFSPAANTFCISTSGVERLIISSVGNVGIGTATPTTTLEIAGNSSDNSLLKVGSLEFQPYALNNAWIGENVYVNGADFVRRADGSAGLFYFQGNEGQFRFSDYDFEGTSVSSNPVWKILSDGSMGVGYGMSSAGGSLADAKFVIDSAGNAGIGTTTPSEILDVVGNIKTGDLVLGYNATFDQYGLTNNNGGGAPLWIISDLAAINLFSSVGITLDGDTGNTILQPSLGNVGIGTTNPNSKLDVTGDVNIDGNLTFDSYTESVVANGNSGTSKTIDLTSGTVHTCTLTGNCTFTMPTATAGKSFSIFLNSGSGNYTASFSGVRWADSAIPTATITASKVDIYSFISDGSFWYGSFSQNYG
jgi:hypothetical protein